MCIKNINLLYELRGAVVELINDYSSVISEVKYKTIPVKWILSMLARIAKVSNRKVSDHSNLKILGPT